MKFYRVIFVLFVFATASWAQKPADDPIAQALFPPELVMKYRQEIDLDDGQSKAIKEPSRKPRPGSWTCSGTCSRKGRSWSSC